MTTDRPGQALDEFTSLVGRRRTNMAVDPTRPVPDELVEQLVELAGRAPCHKRTWPWRFAVCSGEGRSRLGVVVAAAMAAQGEDEHRVDKARTKYLRTPTVVVVGSAPGDTPLRTVENRDAVAAAVEHLLLGATAAGLASYWSSCPKGASTAVAELCGFETGSEIVAIVYLGWELTAAADVPRPTPPVFWLRD
jgi:nitroreductase